MSLTGDQPATDRPAVPAIKKLSASVGSKQLSVHGSRLRLGVVAKRQDARHKPVHDGAFALRDDPDPPVHTTFHVRLPLANETAGANHAPGGALGSPANGKAQHDRLVPMSGGILK